MTGSRSLRATAACALSLGLAGCGERSGDPIILVVSRDSEGGASDGASAVSGSSTGAENGRGGSPGGSAGADGGSLAGGVAGTASGTPLGTGPVGLCGECRTSDECGDANDACIRHEDQRFCGRDCFDERDCPDGYACVELANSQLYQCVPASGCPQPAVAPPTLDQLRLYLLEQINAERAARDHGPLSPSSCLDQLAQESALSYAATDEPLGKFVKECDPIWPSCACGWTAEAEIAVARYALGWQDAADHALGRNRDTQGDRFVQAYRDYEADDVGIGFWISGDEAWIALSFR